VSQTTNHPQRTRTIIWDDPQSVAQAAATMSGLDFLRAMFNGEIPQPPITALLDFEGSEVEHGRAVFIGRPAEFHYNLIGTVHGGFAATLLDSALGCAVHTTLPQGVGYFSTCHFHISCPR
jgi:acyl-coenzyme A thioesterase PaaI-like protein